MCRATGLLHSSRNLRTLISPRVRCKSNADSRCNHQTQREKSDMRRRSKYKKIPAPVCQRDTPMVYSESPSLQRLTNDSPGYNNWLSSKTSTPIGRVPHNKFYAAREMYNLWVFDRPFCSRSEETACLYLLRIFSICPSRSKQTCLQDIETNMTGMSMPHRHSPISWKLNCKPPNQLVQIGCQPSLFDLHAAVVTIFNITRRGYAWQQAVNGKRRVYSRRGPLEQVELCPHEQDPAPIYAE